MTNVKSLLEMYVKMGGSLTDTYSDIAGGVPVGQYSTISDAILACSKKYSAGGGGGGAEKFVVTLTQDEQTEEWTADKTVAEIVAADAAGKIVVCVYPATPQFNVNLACGIAESYPEQSFDVAGFAGINQSDTTEAIAVSGVSMSGTDRWTVTITPIVSSAPLIVTLTADQSTGNLVGNKTYKEVYDAFDGGQTVTLKGNTGSITFASNALSVGLANDGYSVAFVFSGSIVEAEGAETDNVSFHVN